MAGDENASALGDSSAPCIGNDWPVEMAKDTDRGRCLVAKKTLRPGQVLLRSKALLTAILPSWKKRVCSFCLTVHSKRLNVSCKGCQQVWYCGEECRTAHGQGSSDMQESVTMHANRVVQPVPHAMLCPVLRMFSGAKCDANMDSVLRMILEGLAREMLDEQAQGDARLVDEGAGMACFVEGPRYADIWTLQSHAADFHARDRKDWLKALEFLRGALARANWPGPIPSAQVMLDVVGRITTNNFGIYSGRGGLSHKLGSVVDMPSPLACASEDMPSPTACADGTGIPERAGCETSGVECDAVDRGLWRSVRGGVRAGEETLGNETLGKETLYQDSGLYECVEALRVLGRETDGDTLGGAVLTDEALGKEALDQDSGLYECVEALKVLGREMDGDTSGGAVLAEETLGKETRYQESGLDECVQALKELGMGMNGGALGGEVVVEDADDDRGGSLPADLAESLVAVNGGLNRAFLAEERALGNSLGPEHGTRIANLAMIPACVTSDGGATPGCVTSDGEASGQGASPIPPSDNEVKRSKTTDVASRGVTSSEHTSRGNCTHSSNTVLQDPVESTGGEVTGLACGASTAEPGESSAVGVLAEWAARKEEKVREDLIGRELFIGVSFFNHSCDPNCIVERSAGGIARVVATRTIEAGEEASISYIDETLPRSARRDALRQGFFFDCACSRCMAELVDKSVKWQHPQSMQRKAASGAPKRRGRKARISR